jgi:hypothetical protein
MNDFYTKLFPGCCRSRSQNEERGHVPRSRLLRSTLDVVGTPDIRCSIRRAVEALGINLEHILKLFLDELMTLMWEESKEVWKEALTTARLAAEDPCHQNGNGTTTGRCNVVRGGPRCPATGPPSG